jgi:hypothetical protein
MSLVFMYKLQKEDVGFKKGKKEYRNNRWAQKTLVYLWLLNQKVLFYGRLLMEGLINIIFSYSWENKLNNTVIHL